MPYPTAALNFPGIQRVLSFTYTCSVGVSPQIIAVEALPSGANFGFGEGPPAVGPGVGTFQFSDGVTGLSLRDCAFAPDGFRQVGSAAGGFVWRFQLYDRRWRWRDGYPVDGGYNQLDKNNKLIPRTVRSPFQLAVILLEAMGEVGYAVDLPGGLAAVGAGLPPASANDSVYVASAEYLLLGQNYPVTTVNPPTRWDGTPAALALANLCEQYGRVVVWNPLDDQVSVQVLGQGVGPPVGGTLNESPGLAAKPLPAAIVARGEPTRYQARLAFRPVGRDWDDSWRPLSELTYAPAVGADQAQKMRVLVFGKAAVVNGVTLSGPTHEAFAAAVNGSYAPAVQGKVTAAAVADGADVVAVLLTAAVAGDEIEVEGVGGGEVVCTAGPVKFEPGFALSTPPSFPQVQATANLSYPQARDLAASTVWKCYQLTSLDPSDFATLGVPIPGGGRCLDRYQILLDDTRPEQVVPRPGDVDRVDPATGQPFFEDSYNGYSKDRAAAAYGSIWRPIGSATNKWAKDDRIVLGNTPKRSRFYVPFRVIDRERQVIEFAEPVYRVLGGATGRRDNAKLPGGASLYRAAVLAPEIVIETGLTLLDAVTSAPLRYTYVLNLGGVAPARLVDAPGAQLEVLGTYDARHKLTAARPQDLYAESAARLHAVAAAQQYVPVPSATRTYVGIVRVALSGLVQQATWHMDAGGFTTTVSMNGEHSTVVPKLPARRRAENLPPDWLRRQQNIATRLLYNAQEEARRGE